MAQVRRGRSLDSEQDHAGGSVKFKFLSLMFEIVRQQRQLVQRFLKLRNRFRHR